MPGGGTSLALFEEQKGRHVWLEHSEMFLDKLCVCVHSRRPKHVLFLLPREGSYTLERGSF